MVTIKTKEEVKSLIERIFEFKGYKCVVRFTKMGHRCGYVGIPKTSKVLHKLNVDNIYVHGGITYDCASTDYPIPNKDTYWIGFDCAHYMDIPDVESFELYYDNESNRELVRIFKEFNNVRVKLNGTAKTMRYCENECRDIVRQLKKLEK